MKNFTRVAIALILLPFSAQAKLTMENVSDALLKEFFSIKKTTAETFQVEEKNTEGLHIETLNIKLGLQKYRLTIFSNGNLELGMAGVNDLAFQEILQSNVSTTTPEQIVRLIQGFESGPQRSQGYQEENTTADEEEKRTKENAKALQWSRLIDRAASGENMSVSGGGGGLEQSISAARMMNHCQSGRGSEAPQRHASQNIAEALVMANLKTQGEAYTDQSKDFETHGKYSFLEELDQFKQSSPERAFQLLQEARTSQYEIFKRSLQESNVESRDPFYLAANRNFMFLVRAVGQDKTIALMEKGLKKVALNVDRFVEYRRMLTPVSIVYDRRSEKFFVDPTLNQPAQARYLVSLVAMYEWKYGDKSFQKLLKQLEQNPKDSDFEQFEKDYKTFLQQVSHPRF